ncbi:hypothetical protein SF1_40080 [Sphingobacterium faecium NBRC 15299]|nr:hypothetical protein SF1_40080 [Sphingobacterium faecium NBRC 15299]
MLGSAVGLQISDIGFYYQNFLNKYDSPLSLLSKRHFNKQRNALEFAPSVKIKVFTILEAFNIRLPE